MSGFSITPTAPLALSSSFPSFAEQRAASNLTPGPSDFTIALSRATTARAGGDFTTVQATMTPREAAEELVATAFIKPLLSQMRETSQATGPFAPTNVEKQFAPMLDSIIAQQIVRSGRFGLVDAVARQMQGAQGRSRAGADVSLAKSRALEEVANDTRTGSADDAIDERFD